ncbi:MAG: DMT family transporter [Candidatus Levyibacteriota bacterium]
MHKDNRLRGAAMLTFTALAWGAMFAVAKSALTTIDAFHLSAFRYAPAAVVMLAILALAEGPRALLPGRDALRLWLFGSLGFAGFSILGFLGIAGSTPEHAAIIVALMPLLTTLMNWLLRGSRPAGAVLVATLAALAGVVLVVTRGRLRIDGGASWHADAMVLAGATCWIAYTMGAATLPRLSALRYTALSMAFGAVSIVAITEGAVAAGFATTPAWPHVLGLWHEIAYLSLVAGVAAVLAWNAGIGTLGAANGVLFINLVPVTAFAIGVAQGHRFGAAEGVGAAMTLAALVASNLAGRRSGARLPMTAATPARARAAGTAQPAQVLRTCG